MKVIIPTKNRAETITTHQVFAGEEVYVLVHDLDQAADYVRAHPELKEHLQVTGVPGDTFGLTRQREWACRELVEPGEWFVFADDNVRGLEAVDRRYYGASNLPVEDTGRDWKAVYSQECSAERFLGEVAPDTIREAERRGAHLCGFAVVDNPFFRGRKFRSVGYVIGKLMLWQNVPFRWDHTISMEDFRNTAEHVLQYGAVVINNYAYPRASHYLAGGMGSYPERVAQRRIDVQRLMAAYPGFFRTRQRKGFAPNTDLGVAIHDGQAERWRASMRAAERIR